MKTWVAALLAAAAVILPRLGSPGTELGMLEPVELVQVVCRGTTVELRTDTGDSGTGETLARAVEDLKARSSREVFLETADFLLLWGEAEPEELAEFFRPACSVCLGEPDTDLRKAAAYLRRHSPDRTLGEWQAGLPREQKLIMENGGGSFAPINEPGPAAGVDRDGPSCPAGPW